jgi:hypothetical protein
MRQREGEREREKQRERNREREKEKERVRGERREKERREFLCVHLVCEPHSSKGFGIGAAWGNTPVGVCTNSNLVPIRYARQLHMNGHHSKFAHRIYASVAPVTLYKYNVYHICVNIHILLVQLSDTEVCSLLLLLLGQATLCTASCPNPSLRGWGVKDRAGGVALTLG